MVASSLFKTCALGLLIAVLTAPLSLKAAAPFFKCSKNGTVTYQNDPCPSGESRKAPTVEQLNADRQKRLGQAGNGPATSPESAPGGQVSLNPSGASGSRSMNEKERPSSSGPPIASQVESFKCDGRIHCSQMTSCSEAKYFLSRCPGVKMDGDGNGVPCEKQWCNR